MRGRGRALTARKLDVFAGGVHDVLPGQLLVLARAAARGLDALDSGDLRASFTAEQATELAGAHRRFVAAYAKANPALIEAMKYGGPVADACASLATILERAPLFEDHDAEQVYEAAVAAHREAAHEMGELLRTPAFAALPRREQARWVNVIAQLRPGDLEAQASALAAFMNLPGVATLPSAALPALIKTLTSVPVDDQDRVIRALETVPGDQLAAEIEKRTVLEEVEPKRRLLSELRTALTHLDSTKTAREQKTLAPSLAGPKAKLVQKIAFARTDTDLAALRLTLAAYETFDTRGGPTPAQAHALDALKRAIAATEEDLARAEREAAEHARRGLAL